MTVWMRCFLSNNNANETGHCRHWYILHSSTLVLYTFMCVYQHDLFLILFFLYYIMIFLYVCMYLFIICINISSNNYKYVF